MPQERPWWNDKKYWKEIYLQEIGTTLEPRLDLIVAEATRRGVEQGKREAWEGAAALFVHHAKMAEAVYGSTFDAGEYSEAINAKLSSLSQSSNEKV